MQEGTRGGVSYGGNQPESPERGFRTFISSFRLVKSDQRIKAHVLVMTDVTPPLDPEPADLTEDEPALDREMVAPRIARARRVKFRRD